MPNAVHHITPDELAEMLRQPDAPRLIDVRERWEWNHVHLPEAELKPLSEIATWWKSLDPTAPYVFQCHHGRRSLQVCIALAAEGFAEVYNLEGGIDRWAEEVAPGMARY